jgi:hypothetical protein
VGIKAVAADFHASPPCRFDEPLRAAHASNES